MKMTGEERIAAPRQRVWEALNDPEVLRQAIPGCQSLEREADDRLRGVVEVKIGPIGARFNGLVTLADIDPPNGYTLSGQGQGGMAGSAKGGARVRLADDGAGTRLTYDVDAEVGGRMAQLGGPIIDATAKQLAGKFFKRFGEIVGESQAQPAVATGSAQATVAEPAAVVSPMAPVAVAPGSYPYPGPAAGTSAGGGFPWLWAVAVALAVLGGFLLGRSEADDIWVIAVVVLALVAAGAGYESGRRSGGRS